LNIHSAEITLCQDHGQRTPQIRLISFTDPPDIYILGWLKGNFGGICMKIGNYAHLTIMNEIRFGFPLYFYFCRIFFILIFSNQRNAGVNFLRLFFFFYHLKGYEKVKLST